MLSFDRSILFPIGILFMLTACGGGGSESDAFVPTDPNQIFSLSKLQSTTLGPVYSSQLSGSDSNGVSYSGSIAIANRAQEMNSGVLTTPRDLILSLTGGGSSITVTGTSYIDSSGDLIGLVIQTTGLICTPVFPDSLPSSVKIGDFGILADLNCDDNTTQSQNWRVEDAGNGNVNLITNGTIRNQFNTITQITDITYTINGSGDIISFKSVSTILASNYSQSLQST